VKDGSIAHGTAADEREAESAFGGDREFGTGLLAAAVARWFLTGLDAWATIWIVFGPTAIAMAVQLMSFLEPEAANG
jgi:hypothetical protein